MSTFGSPRANSSSLSDRRAHLEYSRARQLTTLASVVSAPELLHEADLARSLTYNTSPLILASLIYLAALWPVVRLMARLEHHLS
ncbi:MAG: hypothetical protein JOY52_07310 [Hyphomicrobiales bacterium]|nr:hypothetical protein [Hyphomicrobiales bacterium]